MLGNVNITAPNKMGLRKLQIFINGEEKANLSNNQNVTIELEKNSTITARVPGNLLSKPISVYACNSTKIEAKYNIFSGNVTLNIISADKVCDYFEEDTSEQALLEFDGGAKDFLYAYEDYVVIKHSGALNAIAMGVKGEKTIYYADITSVQYKKPGIASGYIQFSLPGGKEDKGGIFSATSDENTITVASGNPTLDYKAQEIVDFINRKLKEVKASKNGNTVITQQLSNADELKKFKELLDMGVITQEEFDAKKKQLLGL